MQQFNNTHLWDSSYRFSATPAETLNQRCTNLRLNTKIKPDWQPRSKSKCCPPNFMLKFIFLMFYELANNINIKSSQSNPEGTDQNQALLVLQCKLHQSLTFHKAWFSLVVCTNCPHSSKDTFSCHCQTEHDMKYLRTSRYQAQNVDSGRKVKAKRRMQWFKSKQWIVCPKTI